MKLDVQLTNLPHSGYGSVQLHRSPSDQFTAVKQASWKPSAVNPHGAPVELRLMARLEWAHMRRTKGAVHLVQGEEYWEDLEEQCSYTRMEYVHGCSLYGLMTGKASSQWTLETCAAIMYQVRQVFVNLIYLLTNETF